MPADVTKTPVPAAITTPSRVETGIGTLEFTDGYPTGETAAKLRDHLDYLHGVETFMNTIQGVSIYAIREGFLDAGIEDGDVLIFSELMDSRSLFLTANADTVYFWSFLDLSDGPLVLETPVGHPGPHRRHVVRLDHRLRSARRGPRPGRHLPAGRPRLRRAAARGRLLRPPLRAPTTSCSSAARSSTQNQGNDPAPTVDRIKEQLKIYPYAAGGVGSSIGDYLTGQGRLGQLATPQSPRFVEGTGTGDEHRPAERLRPLRDAGRAGAAGARRGARHRAGRAVRRHRDRQGREVRARPRLRAILDEAVAVGNAASRTLGMGAHPTEGFRYYDDGDRPGGTCCSSAGSSSPTRRR